MNTRSIGEPIPEPIVRQYTEEEKALVRPAEREDAAAKLARIIRTAGIDRQRYSEAIATHPEKTTHFTRLIEVGKVAVEQWTLYYQEQAITPDAQAGALPYDGNEQPTTVPAHVTEPARAFLPA